jgi:hypothetical protein
LFAYDVGMNGRRRRRVVILFRLLDVFIVLGLFAAMVIAIIRWPDKILADVALPAAFLITYAVCRQS